jgi:hypothetical protein
MQGIAKIGMIQVDLIYDQVYLEKYGEAFTHDGMRDPAD